MPTPRRPREIDRTTTFPWDITEYFHQSDNRLSADRTQVIETVVDGLREIVLVVTRRTQLTWACSRRGGNMAGSWRPRTVPSRVTIILLPSALHNLLTLHEELRKRRTEQSSRRHPWKNSRCSFERSRARSLERSNAKRMRKPEAIVHPTSNATTQAHGLLRQIDGEMRIVLDVWNTKTTSSNICRMRNQVTTLDARIRMRGERESEPVNLHGHRKTGNSLRLW